MGSWDWDMKASRTEVTDRCRQILDYSNTEAVTYENWRSRVHLDDRVSTEASVEKALSDREEFEAQYRIIGSDGSIRWVDALGRFYYDESGRPERMLGVVADITDRKLAELALQESERRYASLAKVSPVGIFRCGRDGNCTYVNERWCEIAGISPKAALGTGWSAVLHPDDRERVINGWKQTIAEQQPFYLEYRFLRLDGTIVWVLGQALPELEENNRVISYIGTITNITENKRTEEVLRESEEQRRLALDLTHIGSWDWQIDLNKVTWNDNHFRLLGLQPKVVASSYQAWRDRVHPEDIDRVEQIVTQALTSQTLDEIFDSLAPPETFTIVVQPDLPTLVARKLLLSQVLSNLISNAIKHHDRSDGRIEIAVTPKGNSYEFSVTDDGPGIAPDDHEKVFGIFETLKSRDAQESTGIGLSIVKKIVETEGGQIVLESDTGKGATFRFTWPSQK